MAGKRNTVIESLGVYLPPKEVSSREIIRACKNTLMYPLARLTGIKRRRMAGEFEFAIDLARQAVATCLERSKYTAADIELVICCNISRYDGPDFHFSFEPSTSVRLKDYFGFPKALCFDISNACAGMFTGTHIADAFLQAGLVKTALVVSGEYITHLTRTAQYEITHTRDERLPCLTLGDSGAAVLLERGRDDQAGFPRIDMYTLGRYSDCCIAKPTKSEAGGAIMLTDSLRIHAVAIRESVKHIIEVLRRVKWSREKVQHFIMHQTARSAINELARQFNEIYREKVLDSRNLIFNLENRGNTSSTSHFVAIWDNIHNGKIQSGDSVIFAIQASGITLGTAPYIFDDLPERLREFERRGTKPANIQVITKKKSRQKRKRPRQRVRIESLGTIPADKKALVPRNSIELASVAAENCLSNSRYKREDIDLLIHAGIYRSEFISEPAIATLIAGKLELNPVAAANAKHKTFAYDVMNGAVSFLNACYTGVAMINSGKARNALVVAAEIENNAEARPDQLLGILETGSALILEPNRENGGGFESFLFRYNTDYIDKCSSWIGQKNGHTYMNFKRDPELFDFYLKCIPPVVDELLGREGLEPADIKAVFPPQISTEFVDKFGKSFEFDPDAIVSLANGKDYFTSSTAYGLQHAWDNGLVGKDDLGLIINVGAGIQVGCALYRF